MTMTPEEITALIKVGAPAIGSVAATVGNVASDLIGLAGGDWVAEARKRNYARLQAKTAAFVGAIPVDRRTEASPSIAVPLLTFAVDESREELSTMWAALLARAQIDGGRTVRRDFFDTLRLPGQQHSDRIGVASRRSELACDRHHRHRAACCVLRAGQNAMRRLLS